MLNSTEPDPRATAARRIQAAWRGHTRNARDAADASRLLAQAMGRPLVTWNETRQVLRAKDQVVIQVNGSSGDPLDGHSGFLVNQRLIDVSNYTLAAVEEHRACGAALHVSRYAFDYVYDDETHRSHAGINFDQGFNIDAQFVGRMGHLAGKGVLFHLNAEFRPFFPQAVNDEAHRFSQQPYGYGLSYNCNAFVHQVLRRLLQLRSARHTTAV